MLNINDIERHLDIMRQNRKTKMDWYGLEDTLVAILNLEDCDNNKKIALVKDCIDAYTKRGHFR